jgi:hypothetical protein
MCTETPPAAQPTASTQGVPYLEVDVAGMLATLRPNMRAFATNFQQMMATEEERRRRVCAETGQSYESVCAASTPGFRAFVMAKVHEAALADGVQPRPAQEAS